MFFTPPPHPEFTEKHNALLALGTDLEIPFREIKLAATRWGKGPPVLLVHGWGGNRIQLGHFIQPLTEAGYSVLAFDAPSHGQSSGSQTNLFEIRDAILQLEADHGPFHAVLAHSLGTLSNMMALDAGLSPSKVVHFGSLRRAIDAVNRFFYIAKISAPLQKAFLDKMENWFHHNPLDVANADQIAKNIDIPALLIHDRDDKITPVADSQAIIANWPGVKYVETEGLGHRGPLRSPEIIQQVIEFIQD